MCIRDRPKRSAIVAFSAGEVYAIAEMLRRFSGGAAVVMGALSPRTVSYKHLDVYKRQIQDSARGDSSAARRSEIACDIDRVAALPDIHAMGS